jgi:hypothetical protein
MYCNIYHPGEIKVTTAGLFAVVDWHSLFLELMLLFHYLPGTHMYD